MAIEVIYRCDRCKAAFEEAKHLWVVSVYVTAPKGSLNEYHQSYPRLEHLWCDDCTKAVGLKVPLMAANQKPVEKPSLESVIKELIKSAIEENESE